MKKLIQTTFGIVTLVFLASCGNMVKNSIYPIPLDTEIQKIPNSEVVEVNSENRISKGLLVKNGKKLIIFFHGNGSTINNELPAANKFSDAGYSVLIAEYPGYGISKNYAVSEKNIYADADSLIKYVQEKYAFSIDDTILAGRSLGSGPAVEMANRKLGNKLILFTPFTSMTDMVSLVVPGFIAGIINSEKYDNILKAKNINMPTLIVHGNKDNTVPYKMAVRLNNTFPHSELVTINTGNHRTFYQDIDDESWKKIISF